MCVGVYFSGDFRDVIISSEWVDRIRGHLEEVNDFTISASVKQNPNNVGTLLAFSRGLIRLVLSFLLASMQCK